MLAIQKRRLLLRIGLVHLGRRGAGNRVSFELAVNLAQMTDLFAVVSIYAENLTEWEACGLEYIPVETYRTPMGALRAFTDRRVAARIADEIGRRRPDVLLFPMFHTLNAFVQSRLRDVPSVVTVHDPVPHPGLSWRAYRLLEDLSLRRAKRCLVLSEALVSEVQRRGFPPQCINLMPLGPLDYGEVAATASGTGDTPLLLFFGRITAYKGLGVFLEACRRLQTSREFRVRIAGHGNLHPYRRLLSQVRRLDTINRWMSDSEIPGIVNEASAVVLPYTSASQSGVVAVCAAYGLPVVASRTGGIPEQVRNGETGLLVEPGSVRELVEALGQVLDNPPWARRLGLALHQEHQARRNWRVAAQEALGACKQALDRM